MAPGVTKKLYADGKFVAEYESTGDYIKDIEICQNLLREKGLLQKPTLEQSIFRQATLFAGVSSQLYARDLATVPTTNGLSAMPFIVNLAFALELYLIEDRTAPATRPSAVTRWIGSII
jgi:hypothetical protein